jgi:hypothetical protein
MRLESPIVFKYLIKNISHLNLTKELSIIKNEGCKDKRVYIFIVILYFDKIYKTA